MVQRPGEPLTLPPRPALPKANILSASISPTSLSFIHVPAAPHTGLAEHRQPSVYPSSSQGRRGTGFQHPLPSLSPALAYLEGSQGSKTQPAPGKLSWSLIKPWSHSHEEGDAGERGRPWPLRDQSGGLAALWATPAWEWAAVTHPHSLRPSWGKD